MKKILICLFFFLSYIFPQKTLAVTLTINSYPTQIWADPFTINVSISKEAKTGTNYLRVDLFKEGTANYFGETYNGNIWYSGSEGKQYFPVSVTLNATTSATFQAKVGNPKTSEFPGSGQYKLRIRRYTDSGSLASGDIQTPVDVNINLLTPTPTPTPPPSSSSSVSSMPIPTATPKSSTPKPSVSSASIPTPKATSISVSLTREISSSKSSQDILGTESAAPSLEPVKKSQEIKTLGANENNLPKILIGLGVIIILSGAGIYLKSLKR